MLSQPVIRQARARTDTAAGKELLTDKGIKAAIAQVRAERKVRTLNDGGGLRLFVRPDESGLWRFRRWVDGSEKLLGLGTYRTQPWLLRARRPMSCAR